MKEGREEEECRKGREERKGRMIGRKGRREDEGIIRKMNGRGNSWQFC